MIVHGGRVLIAFFSANLVGLDFDPQFTESQTAELHPPPTRGLVLVDAGLRSTQTLVSGVSHSGIVMDLFDKSAPHHSQVL